MSTKKKAAAQPTTFDGLISMLGYHELPAAEAPVKGVQGYWKPRKVPKDDLHLSIVRRGAIFTVVVAPAPDAPKHAKLRFPCTSTGDHANLVAQLQAQVALAGKVIKAYRWCGCGNRTRLKAMSSKPYIRFECVQDDGSKSCGKHIDVPEVLHRELASIFSAARH
jgi:hypothetical protein